MKNVVYVGSDHAGFDSKELVQKYLMEKGLDVIDLGTFNSEACDYPDIGREVGEKVREHKNARAVVLCGSGIGISIAVNKIHNCRCALVYEPELAVTARQHNNANVLAMGARFTEFEKMKDIIDVFFSTDFEKDADRHVRRVDKLNAM